MGHYKCVPAKVRRDWDIYVEANRDEYIRLGNEFLEPRKPRAIWERIFPVLPKNWAYEIGRKVFGDRERLRPGETAREFNLRQIQGAK